jgi:hypothetical protein
MCWTSRSSAGTPRQGAWSTSSGLQSTPFTTTIRNCTSPSSRNFSFLIYRIDVLQLVEEAVEGSWIGHRARMLSRQQESEIGSLYAPPKQDGSGKKLVEIVIEIGDRDQVSELDGAAFFAHHHQIILGAQCPI